MILKMPADRAPERRHVARWVFRDRLNLRLDFASESRANWCITGRDGGKRLLLPDSFFSAAEGRWLRPDSLPSEPLPTLEAGRLCPEADLVRPDLPVISGEPNAEGAWLANLSDGVAYLGVDVLGSAFFMLSRYEEVACPETDEHGRFPASSSLAHRAAFLDRPIIDEYVELLRALIERTWPPLDRPRGSYSVVMTHDVDHPSGAKGLGAARLLRKVGGDLVRRRRPALAARRLGSALLPGAVGESLDPNFTFDRLMRHSERRGLRSAFYFMATEPSTHDAGYDLLSPRMLHLLSSIHDRGHEIGFHPSYRTLGNPERLNAELRMLERAMEASGVREPEIGGRQHYLRWDATVTWRQWEQAGLDYDSSVGYAQRPGFRSGTAHDYPAWSFAERRELALRERPLTVMEGTLFSDRYLGLEVDDALELVERLAQACRTVDGHFTFLWHNHYHLEVGSFRVYEDLMDVLLGK